MYKSVSRVLQSVATSNKSRSGYSKDRHLRTGPMLLINHSEFVAGTVYVGKLVPLICECLTASLRATRIVQRLKESGIQTPSGRPWTRTAVAELIRAVRDTISKSDRGRFRRRRLVGAGEAPVSSYRHSRERGWRRKITH
jgi:hypothetical protein